MRAERTNVLIVGLLHLGACQEQAAVPAGANVPGAGELASILEPMRAEGDVPALAGAIVEEDGRVRLGVVGVRKAGDPTPAALEDPFHLGSDTKAMTAVVVGRAVDDGRLTFLTTIGDVFPEWKGSIDSAYLTVTVDQLLAHRGGLIANLNDAKASFFPPEGDLRAPRLAHVKQGLQQKPHAPPGTTFFYSNLGYVTLAAMVEQRTGRAWEELVNEEVWTPLHIEGALFGPAGKADHVDAPWAHAHILGFRIALAPSPYADNPVVINPAGRVSVPLRGWARFIADQLASFHGGGKLLRPETYEHLHTPLFGGDYVGGWGVREASGGVDIRYSHDGSNTRNYATARLFPAKHFAVLVATNQGGDAAQNACDRAAKALVRLHDDGLAQPPGPGR